MLALTLWPEWAHAIAYLGKDIENRTWVPPRSLPEGSLFLIHAGAHIGGRASKKAGQEGLSSLGDMAQIAGLEGLAAGYDPENRAETNFACDGYVRRIQRSAFVAVVRFLGTVHRSDSPWFVGPVGWRLELVKRLDPPLAHSPGLQGLWRASISDEEILPE